MPPAELCRFCKQVNFAAIFTPRELDEETKRTTTIFRPEHNGNGQSPSLEWTRFGKSKRTGPPEDHLPQIRTANYDELSISSLAEQEIQDRHAEATASAKVWDLSHILSAKAQVRSTLQGLAMTHQRIAVSKRQTKMRLPNLTKTLRPKML